MSGTFLHVKGDGGSFTGIAVSNYCQFLREKCFRGKMYSFQHFKQMACKKKPAICHKMWLVDAGESVAQKEGQGRPSKLTKAREKKVIL